MSKVLVFGCGPAGLMTAHAAALGGHDVIIVSKKRKSELFGCQYLHQPIPKATTSDPVNVSYRLTGSEQEYREKVYGYGTKEKGSPEDLVGDHQGWDIRETYDNLWAMYGQYVMDRPAEDFEEIGTSVNRAYETADVVYSTIPANVLCRNEEHVFGGVQVWAIGDAPTRGQTVPFECAENTVICNGEESPGWYRMARVFGHTSVEWPPGRKPPVEGVVPFIKPLKTTCDCNPRITRLGRYGKWEKGVLSHDAFNEATTELAAGQGVLF